jgi:hypothetical protein
VIRTAVFAALVLAAASPALAFEHTTVAAPKGDNGASFIHLDPVMRLAPAGASEPFRFGGEPQKNQTVVYDVSKGKPAARLDVTNPRDNPFMLQPEHAPAPAH